MSELTVKQKLELVKDDPEILRKLVSECAGWDGSLDNFEWQEFDDYFFDNYFSKPEEAARAVYFGSIHNWNDDYIRFDAYGNLESATDWDVDKELTENADEIIERTLELVEEGNIDIDYILEDIDEED